ncbi:MAG: hypothetical protein CM1200mP10_16620 [Candidatus Neomarinimicrobiota bacterium]|nr:MAG: hypothetical protein CM1200mP10_16620 [Candidatus Neomarinimicrobiota bacterium]
MSYGNQFKAHTQLKLSPFFERTSKLNESQEWRRWSGYLAATNYELTHENEYFAIRTKAALLDITPLYKYIIEGPDAQLFLNRMVTRNISICNIGRLCTPLGATKTVNKLMMERSSAYLIKISYYQR